MKILAIADIHGDIQALGRILEQPAARSADVVACPGNLTDMFKGGPDFPQTDSAEMVVQKLLSLNKPLLCVPGNHDPPETLDLLDDYGVNLHSKQRTLLNTTFAGFGGAHTPFNTLFEPTEEEVKAALKSFTNPQVLLIHNPPKNTPLDKIKTGEHVGSSTVREFILSKKPLLVLTAHIHEAAGQAILGPTTLLNPGPAFQGRYALAELRKNEAECKLLSLKP